MGDFWNKSEGKIASSIPSFAYLGSHSINCTSYMPSSGMVMLGGLNCSWMKMCTNIKLHRMKKSSNTIDIPKKNESSPRNMPASASPPIKFRRFLMTDLLSKSSSGMSMYLGRSVLVLLRGNGLDTPLCGNANCRGALGVIYKSLSFSSMFKGSNPSNLLPLGSYPSSISGLPVANPVAYCSSLLASGTILKFNA